MTGIFYLVASPQIPAAKRRNNAAHSISCGIAEDDSNQPGGAKEPRRPRARDSQPRTSLAFPLTRATVNEVTTDSSTFEVRLLTPDAQGSTQTKTIQVSPDQHIWDAAFAAGIPLPALCHQGRCLTCAGRLDGPGEVDQSDSVSYYPEDHEAGFVLLCTGKPRTSLRIRTHRAQEMREHRRQKKLPAPYS